MVERKNFYLINYQNCIFVSNVNFCSKNLYKIVKRKNFLTGSMTKIPFCAKIAFLFQKCMRTFFAVIAIFFRLNLSLLELKKKL